MSTVNETTNREEEVYAVNVEAKKEVSTSTQVWRSFESIGVEVSNILESVFSDYLGIEFKFNQGMVQPFLYFKTGQVAETNDGRVRAYEDLQMIANNNGNIAQMALSIGNYMSQKKKHKITKAGQDILSALVYCNKPNDFKWNNNFNEEVVQAYSNGRPFNTERIAAYGFDFVKLLRFIKIGGIDDIADERKYQIRINRVPCQRYQASGIYYNEILCINIDNMDEFNKVAEKYHVGVVPQMGMMNGNIITTGTAL